MGGTSICSLGVHARDRRAAIRLRFRALTEVGSRGRMAERVLSSGNKSRACRGVWRALMFRAVAGSPAYGGRIPDVLQPSLALEAGPMPGATSPRPLLRMQSAGETSAGNPKKVQAEFCLTGRASCGSCGILDAPLGHGTAPNVREVARLRSNRAIFAPVYRVSCPIDPPMRGFRPMNPQKSIFRVS
jgi:hypothetical protein